MSRIGKLPISVQKGVQVEVQGQDVKVKGPKGELSRTFPQGVTVSLDDSTLTVARGDDTKGRDAVFGSHQFHEITMYYPMRTIVTEKYKLIVNLDHQKTYPFASDLWGSPSWQHIRTAKVKMMGQRSVDAFLQRPKEELYDLSSDPNELKNLAGDSAYASVLQDMRQRLRAWQTATDDPWTILYREERR